MKIRLIHTIQRNFGVQVFAAFTGLILLISVSFISLLAHFQYQAKISELENTGKLMAEILAYQSRLGLYSGNREMLQVPVESLLNNPAVLEACLLDEDAKPVIRKKREEQAGSDPPGCGGNPGLEAIVEQSGERSCSRVLHGTDALMVWSPVFLRSEAFYWDGGTPEELPIGYVRILLGKTHLKEQLHATLFNTVALGLAFWAAGALIAYFLVKQIHQPIRQLTRSVRRFGTEGVCDGLPVESRNEIGSLAKAFQEMTDSLKAHLQREVDTAKELAHARSLAQLGMAASKVTHEVGNLLNNMNLVLPIFRTEPISPKSDRLLSLLESETDRTKIFISDFLQFARKPVLNMSQMPFDLIIKEVFDVYKPQASHAGIHLLLDWPEGLAPVTVDHRAMYQAISNLVKNSMEAVCRNGTIRVSGHGDGAGIVVTIEDSGPGIKPSDRERLFELFFTTKGNQGTGLGLPIVQSIVQAHRGTISCESVPGQTRFTIRLPLT